MCTILVKFQYSLPVAEFNSIILDKRRCYAIIVQSNYLAFMEMFCFFINTCHT